MFNHYKLSQTVNYREIVYLWIIMLIKTIPELFRSAFGVLPKNGTAETEADLAENGREQSSPAQVRPCNGKAVFLEQIGMATIRGGAYVFLTCSRKRQRERETTERVFCTDTVSTITSRQLILLFNQVLKSVFLYTSHQKHVQWDSTKVYFWRPSQTWLRTVEGFLHPLKLGHAMARRRSWNRLQHNTWNTTSKK